MPLLSAVSGMLKAGRRSVIYGFYNVLKATGHLIFHNLLYYVLNLDAERGNND